MMESREKRREEKRREEKRGKRERPVALHDLDDGEQRSEREISSTS
jgi:hypothetical protein